MCETHQMQAYLADEFGQTGMIGGGVTGLDEEIKEETAQQYAAALAAAKAEEAEEEGS